MKYLHDIIKIRYVREGYLPNYPYHMISDNEMFNAFMPGDDDTLGYFSYYYPAPEDPDLLVKYNTLVDTLKYHIAMHKADPSYEIPAFVYSYMFAGAVGVRSNYKYIHDIINPLGAGNIDDAYTEQAMAAVYNESKYYLDRVQTDKTVEYEGQTIHLRPPTIFGEAHVVKSIRQRLSSGI